LPRLAARFFRQFAAAVRGDRTLTAIEDRPAIRSLGHIRRDRILQEALATGADPLHLTLVFNIGHAGVMAYAGAASNLLSSRPDRHTLLPVARNEHEGASAASAQNGHAGR
jgi:hypothetical protein